MEATAPCVLALSVSLDAVATLSLVLLSYDGPFWQAMLPRTGDLHTDIAGGLADLLGLQLLRSSLAMLPLLGVGLGTSPLGAALSALLDCAMTAWLVAKAVLQVQLADGRLLHVGDTGVTLHLPLVLAAEVFGIIMTWTVFALVWANRHVIKQPAGRSASRVSAQGPYVALMSQNADAQQRASVASWLAQSAGGDIEAGTSAAGGAGNSSGNELAQPLLQQGADAAAGDDDAESFVTAMSRSRQGSRASQSSLGSDLELYVSQPAPRPNSRLGPQ